VQLIGPPTVAFPIRTRRERDLRRPGRMFLDLRHDRLHEHLPLGDPIGAGPGTWGRTVWRSRSACVPRGSRLSVSGSRRNAACSTALSSRHGPAHLAQYPRPAIAAAPLPAGGKRTWSEERACAGCV